MSAEIADPRPEAPALQSLSDSEFRRVAAIASQDAGLMISDAKRMMVQSRLSRRVRALGCADFATYLASVETDPSGEERRALISVLTTNVSSFFRESHHFDMLRSTVLPPLIDRAKSGGRVRLWSAGCSSGQEPYSIAMLILELDPDARARDVRILASDIDPAILSKARAGAYRPEDAVNLPSPAGRRFFKSVGADGMVSVTSDVRSMVSFRALNLHSDWPMKQKFDVIFCRNVVIYFDGDRQRSLWPRFHKALSQGGWLFLGHSERIHPIEGSGFTLQGVTAYRRDGGTPDPNAPRR